MEKADKMTGKLKIKNPVTGIDEKGKEKTSWNYQNYQSGQPKQEKDKLKCRK